MNNFPFTAQACTAAFDRGEISAREIAQASLARITRLNPGLNAFIEVTAAARPGRGHCTGCVPRTAGNRPAPGRRALRGEKSVRRGGPHHPGGCPAPRGQPARHAGCHAGGTHAGGRRPACRHPQHGCLCLRLHHGKHPLRRHPQSPGSAALRGGLVRGHRRRGGRRAGAHWPGQRYQWFHPGAGLAVRNIRTEAHLRPSLPQRHPSLRRQPGPPGPPGDDGHRPDPGLRRPAGPGPARPGLRPAPARRLSCRTCMAVSGGCASPG